MATDRAPIPFIGVRAYRNRTPTGRRTATPARRAARYLAFGRERQAGQAAEQRGEQRGQWVGPDGGVRSHEAVLAWAREGALGHRYTFQALLSVQQGVLGPKDFTQAMEKGGLITDWRLVVHRDTDYRHAHVLFFGDKRLQKETFLAWQEQVREELVRLEEQRLSSHVLRDELALEQGDPEQERGREMAQAWEVGLG
jgi:hypothetical protein